MRLVVSNTIVLQRWGSVGVQLKPGWLGLPVRAKLAHAVDMVRATRCASGVLPVP